MTNYIQIDALSWVMMGIIGFIALSVGSFSVRYLQGDRAYGRFFTCLALMVLSLFALVSMDHVGGFIAAWMASNTLLVLLMVHKPGWQAARASGMLAFTGFVGGALALGTGLAMLSWHANSLSIASILRTEYPSFILLPSLGLISLAAVLQSGVWPFHRWLTSSLNSPTPVSAIMHAGLVNGGGFLIARFAPLYVQEPNILALLFIFGLISALLGTLWKLMQHDVKRMLACSTMGQMGFMIMQCGLGLFPAAISHLCWHGFFKAYLFLSSGSAAQEKRLNQAYPPTLATFSLALCCGLFGAYAFAKGASVGLTEPTTHLFLVGMVWVAASQTALNLLGAQPWKNLAKATILTLLLSMAYGASLRGFEQWLAPMNFPAPQALTPLHVAGWLALVVAWVALIFARRDRQKPQPWKMALYVTMLNHSQPHPKTVTAYRKNYQF